MRAKKDACLKHQEGSQHFRHLTRIAPTTFAKPPSTNQRSSPYFLSHSAQSITSATIDLPQWRHDCRSRCHPYRPPHRRPFTTAHRIITATSAFPHTPAHFSEPNRRIRSHRIGPDLISCPNGRYPLPPLHPLPLSDRHRHLPCSSSDSGQTGDGQRSVNSSGCSRMPSDSWIGTSRWVSPFPSISILPSGDPRQSHGVPHASAASCDLEEVPVLILGVSRHRIWRWTSMVTRANYCQTCWPSSSTP